MINSNAYNYINVLDKAADASWLRESTLTNNVANVDTPGFKRKDVDFESVLNRAIGNTKYTSLDSKMKNINLNKLNATTYTDSANYSYRLDGNNVDIDQEQSELASEQIRYSGLTDSMTQEINRMKMVLKS
jgi:flagellar basal-body rod protein FlgB